MERAMNKFLICFIILLGTNYLFSQPKGSCPPIPRNPTLNSQDAPHNPHHQDDTYAGTISILAVINDKGFTCHLQLIRGVDENLDKEEIGIAYKWHFPPTKQGGHPVPFLFRLDVDYWLNSSGDFVRGSERIATTTF